VHNSPNCLTQSLTKEELQMFAINTKTGKLLNALQSGEALTESEISKRFGLKNPRASVSHIRYTGFAVYANQTTTKTGQSVTKYRMGRPSREIVAAGYRAMALGL